MNKLNLLSRVSSLALIFVLAASAWATNYPALTGTAYNRHGMAEMKPCEVGENLPLDQRTQDYCGHNYVVPYFTSQAQRDQYRAVFVNGQVVHALDPNDKFSDGDLFFVMDPAGNFYLFDKGGDAPLHHSTFFSGGPIAAGGNLRLQDGQIAGMGTYTGHYMMTDEIQKNAIKALKASNVSLDNVQNLGPHP